MAQDQLSAQGGDKVTFPAAWQPKGPQLVEITPDKKIVWVLQDWQTLGGATDVQALDDPGIPEIPGESEH